MRNMLVVILVATLLMAGTVRASTVVIQRSQAWVVYGGTAEDNTPLCGIRSHDRDTQGVTREFHIKWYLGNDYLTVQIFKENWIIPHDTRLQFDYRIDNGERFSGNAFGTQNRIEWQIGFSTFDSWLRQFMIGTTLRLNFRQGNEPTMNVSLYGSSAAMTTMATCMRVQRERNGVIPPRTSGAPTRPY